MEHEDGAGLVCVLSDQANTGTARASDGAEAAADLLGAIQNVRDGGTGECFWLRESGAYRWLIKRTGDSARLVVLWSAGTLTGWENVFWADCDWPAFDRAVSDELARYAGTGSAASAPA